jgi:hypothetical protein
MIDQVVFDRALSVVVDFPKSAIAPLAQTNATGGGAADGGSRGAELQLLRSNLAELAGIPRQLALQLTLLGKNVQLYNIAMEQAGLQIKNNDIAFFKDSADQIAKCAVAVSDIPKNVLSVGGNAVATCANAFVQIGLSAQLRENANKIQDLQKQTSLLNLAKDTDLQIEALNKHKDRMDELIGMINANLTTIDNQATTARRALDQVALLASEELKVHYESHTTMRRRLSLTSGRYHRAFKDAQWQAFLAKRAIEQRLGVEFSELRSDLPLVAAPSKWESTLCERRGLRVSSIGPLENYGDAFIGEYVSNLERVVESYMLEHNFKEGKDTAVVSLRDDVVQPRSKCLTPTRNLLSYSGDLTGVVLDDQEINPLESSNGWKLSGCATATVNGLPTISDCIRVVADRNRMLPVSGNSVPAQVITRGPACTASCPPCPGPDCSLNDNAVILQRVALGSGDYRLSYYTQPQALSGGEVGYGAVSVLDEDGSVLASPAVFRQSQFAAGGASDDLGVWKRVHADFSISTSQTVTVRIGRDQLSAFPARQTVVLAGFSLESTTAATLAMVPIESHFVSTLEYGLANQEACATRDGDAFRFKAWKRRCLQLCSTGYGTLCPEAGEREQCFQEMGFDVNQKAIEMGEQLQQAGFAQGNFNYRIDSVAVNFVGTSVRECSDVHTGSETCFNSGFVQFSLDHIGPFFVRNHYGGYAQSHLFNASIEHGRGLAAERYISNPIASTDRDLMQDFVRGELQGRPLDGHFNLRIWEHPGVNLNAIEDVQLVLNYRYWTRFK